MLEVEVSMRERRVDVMVEVEVLESFVVGVCDAGDGVAKRKRRML